MSGPTEPLLFEALSLDPLVSVFLIVAPTLVLGLTSGWFVRSTLRVAGIDGRPVGGTERSVRLGSVMDGSRHWTLYLVGRESDGSRRDTGTVIGKIENVLVVLFVLLGAYTALSIVFAGKSIVRKDDMDRGNTTYYLTGTIANFAYSLVWGLLTNVLIRGTVT